MGGYADKKQGFSRLFGTIKTRKSKSVDYFQDGLRGGKMGQNMPIWARINHIKKNLEHFQGNNLELI